MGRERSAINPLYVIEHWQLAEADAGRQHLSGLGYDVKVVEPWRGEVLPPLTGDEAGVMIMGGPQMITEANANKNAYLIDELRLIEDAMKKQVPLIGVCLGSQMIAKVMGAKVGFHPQNHMAMGYYPITVTQAGQALGLKDQMMVLNGNEQGWEMPNGVERLAGALEDNPFANQAFKTGKTLALQFHPEVTGKILAQWKADFASSFGRPGTQSMTKLDAGFKAHDPALKAWYRSVLEEWFGN